VGAIFPLQLLYELHSKHGEMCTPRCNEVVVDLDIMIHFIHCMNHDEALLTRLTRRTLSVNDAFHGAISWFQTNFTIEHARTLQPSCTGLHAFRPV
jgi:hypothetical protein